MKLRLLGTSYAIILLLFLCDLLSGCFSSSATSALQDGPPRRYVNVNRIPNAIPHHLPRSKYGNPPSYEVNGVRYYVLQSAKGYNRRGIASWYGTKFNGKLTSSRHPYNMLAMTAASKVLPLPTFVRVTNLQNGRWVIVKVNDRGPFAENRIIDMSWAAAAKLGFARHGTALVQVTAIDINHPNQLPPAHKLEHATLYLQVGAFRDYANARHLRARLARLISSPIILVDAQYRDQPIYLVQIGPLRSVDESDQIHAKLQHNGFGDAMSVVK